MSGRRLQGWTAEIHLVWYWPLELHILQEPTNLQLDTPARKRCLISLIRRIQSGTRGLGFRGWALAAEVKASRAFSEPLPAARGRRPAEAIRCKAMEKMNGHTPEVASDLKGQDPDATDFANYFCTYAFLFHQVSGPVVSQIGLTVLRQVGLHAGTNQ